jgi:Ca2+-binding RTX toxin-like protein
MAAALAALYVATGAAQVTNTGTIRALLSNAVFSTSATDGIVLANTGLIEARSTQLALRGGGGDDVVTNAGTLIGGVALRGGADLYEGSQGKVSGLVNGGDGADTLIGGAGFDLLDYAASTVGVHIDLEFNDAAFGDAAGDEIAGFEGVRGSIRADTLTGSADANWLAGGSNNDVLSGGAGNDTLLGEVGADTITGGAGADLLVGGNLPDVFRYRAVSDSTPAASGRDRIRDFRKADLDKIDLSAIDADPVTPLDQAFSFIGAAPFAPGVKGQLRAVVSGEVTLVEADLDGNMIADMRIVLTGAITMAATDVVL